MPAPTFTVLPYRTSDGEVHYASAPSSQHFPYSYNPNPTTSGDDSDNEPLIPSQPPISISELSDNDLLHFTATGRPLPATKISGLQNMGSGIHMFAAPQLLPQRYTDDSIIPAIITDVVPKGYVEGEEGEGEGRKRRGSFLRRLAMGGGKEERKGRITKVVYMPRREYQRFFARDTEGVYVGKEPHRRWTEEELEETFREYKPKGEKRKGYRPPT